MKLKHLVPSLLSAILLTVGTARADDFLMDHFDFAPGTASFSEEASLDLFGQTASRNRNGTDERAWGFGAAGNYFFNQFVGVGAETYADAFNKPYLLNGLGEVRYPLEWLSLAPYGFFGLGRQWTYSAQWLINLGGGVEWRFAPKTGAFVDVRHVFATNTSDYTMLRFGLRLVF